MIAIVNYGVGNLTSILNMHRRLGVDAVISSDPEEIARAEKILLPGVGHFDSCMQNFNRSGLRPLIEKRALEERIPVIGICVGAQMMTRQSEEGKERGLGWIDADTIRFHLPSSDELKVPHMGWADVRFSNPAADLWKGMPEEPRFYFAHSYHFKFDSEEYVSARTFYGYEYVCAFYRENICGVQFHPEKSHRYGMRVIANFAAL
jgi:glutamine amidotransferase